MKVEEEVILIAKSLYDRGLTPGSSGNISIRYQDGFLITPTKSSLGRLEVEELAFVDSQGLYSEQTFPSKELPLHLAMYKAHPESKSVVHLHSINALAYSCLDGLNSSDCLPQITAYQTLRLEKVPLIGYFPPGSIELAESVSMQAHGSRALLLANHGSIVAGSDLESAADLAELLEQSAGVALMLKGYEIRNTAGGRVQL